MKCLTLLLTFMALLPGAQAKALSPGSGIETDAFTTRGGHKVYIYAIKHASLRIVVDSIEIEVDPVGKLGDKVTDYATYPKADYILVTHEHGDHFDPEAIKTLTGKHTVLVTNKRCADQLGYGVVMKNGDSKRISQLLRLEAVPAYNTTAGREKFHPKGRDNGFILSIDGLRIYVAGDTEDVPEMRVLSGIDIAFLPCNQPYTMTTEQLVHAARMVRPKILIPYHYGQTDVSDVPRQLRPFGIEVRIRQLQ